MWIVLSRPLTHIYVRISYFFCSAYICYINKNNFVKKTVGTYLSMYFITSESMKIINFVFSVSLTIRCHVIGTIDGDRGKIKTSPLRIRFDSKYSSKNGNIIFTYWPLHYILFVLFYLIWVISRLFFSRFSLRHRWLTKYIKLLLLFDE
jgi:hypothetical protein